MKKNKSISSHYEWLEDEEYGNHCKQELVKLYEAYFNEKDEQQKDEIFKQLEVYLSIVCDVIAYRYLVKHYTNLFYKLCITVDDYMAYKVKRLLVTVKEKKDKIDDILSYTYMSFMLSSPRLIYDYAEKVGHCKLVKETQPYYKVARDKFFGNNSDKNTEAEHYIYNVDNLYLDEDNDTTVHSNLDNYSYSQWKNTIRTQYDGVGDFDCLINKLLLVSCDYSEESENFLLDLFNNWKNNVESDYHDVKLKLNANNDYSILDYIKYKYEHKQTNLKQSEYIEVLKILNSILKGE